MCRGTVFLNLVLLLLTLNFVSGSRLEQVNFNSSRWFSAVCAAAIVQRNPFFRLYQQNKSSASRVKFGQVSNRCKRVLESIKLAYANKAKKSVFLQKSGPRDLWRIVNNVLNEGKFAIP